MAGLKKAAIAAGLETLYFSGTHRLARGILGGVGAILMFHHVRPLRDDAFQPNRNLDITPDFLDEVLGALVAADVDIVSIDEAWRRLTRGDRSRRFVVLTFDDGYRDNLTFAWPVLARYQVPFTIYVASAFADGVGDLWWLTLEEAIAANDHIAVVLGGIERVFECVGTEAKNATFDTIYWWLRRRRDEAELRTVVRTLAADYGIDMAGECRRECMGWSELASLADHPLVTIGAHTVDHVMLAKVSAANARAQMVNSVSAIERKLGVRPEHFAYPVGSHADAGPREFAIAAEVGFKTAVTTRPGILFGEHARHLMALPRISINGEFQRLRYLDVLLSGAATALWNGFRRVDAA